MPSQPARKKTFKDAGLDKIQKKIKNKEVRGGLTWVPFPHFEFSNDR